MLHLVTQAARLAWLPVRSAGTTCPAFLCSEIMDPLKVFTTQGYLSVEVGSNKEKTASPPGSAMPPT